MSQLSRASASPSPPLRGLRTFFLVWLGQLLSIIGSNLTSFALGVQVYQDSGSVTLYTLILASSTLPGILVLPLAGVLIDRWDRRMVMLLSDLGAGVGSLLLALLFFSGTAQIWQICLLVALTAGFTAFQWPTFMAVTTLLVPKQHLLRANLFADSIQGIARIVAPLLATTLLATFGLALILLLDAVSFLISICCLLLVRFPHPATTQEATATARPWYTDITFGWHYIAARPGLFTMMILIALSNFVVGMAFVLLNPLILAFSSLTLLGPIVTFATSGFMVGGTLLTIWGGPRRRIYLLLAFQTITALSMLCLGLFPSLVVFALAGFGLCFSTPPMRSASQAIWQVKVAPEVQGRVFAFRQMITWSTLPLAQLAAGPLADHVFTPLLLPGGALAETLVGRVLGVGPGYGLALLFVLLGSSSLLIVLGGLLYPRLRRVEDEIPDAIGDPPAVQHPPVPTQA